MLKVFHMHDEWVANIIGLKFRILNPQKISIFKSRKRAILVNPKLLPNPHPPHINLTLNNNIDMFLINQLQAFSQNITLNQIVLNQFL